MHGCTHSLEALDGLIDGEQLLAQAALEFVLTVAHDLEMAAQLLGGGVFGLYLTGSEGGEVRVAEHLQ